MENPLKMDDNWWYPYFRKPPVCSFNSSEATFLWIWLIDWFFFHPSLSVPIQNNADNLTPNWFAGWWFEPLWKILVNWDNYSQYMGKQKMATKPPTSSFSHLQHLPEPFARGGPQRSRRTRSGWCAGLVRLNRSWWSDRRWGHRELCKLVELTRWMGEFMLLLSYNMLQDVTCWRGISETGGTPKSSMLAWFSLINHHFP